MFESNRTRQVCCRAFSLVIITATVMLRRKQHVLNAAILAGCTMTQVSATSLDDYVNQPDETYSFDLRETKFGRGYTAYDLVMNSQTWRTEADVSNRNEWEHFMRIVKPDEIQHDTAVLRIRGSNNGQWPGVDTRTALASGTVVVELPQVPNQPLSLVNSRGGFDSRTEDGILARSFRHFLDGGDAEWPALLPMVNSAVRAMDTTQQFMADQGVDIRDFVVTGHSKRGWTTWLTAATDERVAAIAPLAIDVLNVDEQMTYHRNVYEDVTDSSICGGYSCAVRDYVWEGIMDELTTPRGQELLEIIDPFEYRDRLDLPKFIVNSTGDQFFVPDSSQFYFDELPGETYLRYLPNTNHSSMLGQAEQAFRDFHGALLAGVDLPKYSWKIEQSGKAIRVQPEDTPLRVRLWQAHNPKNRDFRQDGIGMDPQWRSTPLELNDDGEYFATVERPLVGATAFMVELVFDVDGNEFPLTTEVSVVHVPPQACDFDVDGACDVNDLATNTLFQIDLAEGTTSDRFVKQYDLNDDEVVDRDDLSFWLSAAAAYNGFDSAYLPGDSNLDGKVDLNDFLLLSENFGGSDRDWGKGNFDGDRDVDFGDFLFLATNYGTELTKPEMTAVPESTGSAVIWICIVAVATRRRQSRRLS